MKEIHLGKVLLENRHRLGVTQDELAEYLGVSKAAVSKWETETTYPDILMLPRLASYFHITIDELMGYEPQLDTGQIRELYARLSEEFAVLPFEQALEHCREAARKYCSCYPLLFQIGSLLINHSMMGGPEGSTEITDEAMALFRKVKTGTDDPSLGTEALQMEALCLLRLNRPEEVLDLLQKDTSVTLIPEPLIASAWQMLGNITEAKRILQVGIYNQLLSMLNLLPQYMNLCRDDRPAYEESCRRILEIADIFHLDRLHPSILLTCLLTMAQGWASMGEKDLCLSLLEKYADLATGEIWPLRLKGDDYFNLIDDWFEKNLLLGTQLPRDEAVIRQSMVQSVAENPAFSGFADDTRFLTVIQRLEQLTTEPADPVTKE